MTLQNLGYILETNIDVGLTTYGVQLDRSSTFGNDIIVFSGAAAEEKAWFDHRAGFSRNSGRLGESITSAASCWLWNWSPG